MIGCMVISQHEAHFADTNEHNLYVPNDPYTASELSAMAYHGALRPQFGPYYIDIDMPDTAAQRAKSVRLAGQRLLDGKWTATMFTAAWIHLGGQAPELFEAATATQKRPKPGSRLMPMAVRHTDYLQRSQVAEDDLLVIGGIVVTGLALTIEDLLRIGGTPRHQLRAGMLAKRVDADELRQRFLRNAALPGMENAQQLLDQLCT